MNCIHNYPIFKINVFYYFSLVTKFSASSPRSAILVPLSLAPTPSGPLTCHVFQSHPCPKASPPFARGLLLRPQISMPAHFHRRDPMPPAVPPSPTSLPTPPPPAPPPPLSINPTTSVPLLLPVFIIFFVLLCFLSIFLFRDLLNLFSISRISGLSTAASVSSTGRVQADAPGLNPTILASFPTLPYSAVKGLQEGKCGCECPVCLAEFAAGDLIRLLTVCCHAFHPECVDSWLASHTTCPLCRSNLEAPPDEAAVIAVREAVDGRESIHAIGIDVDSEEAAGTTAKETEERSSREEERNTIRTERSAEDQTASRWPGSAELERAMQG
ncbi:RING-H2 finger protein ATL29 [Apostasia shenzhenica]|uniref:RING-type E3 ubiquitin transferase n=1 Tax=Apostasia shenzhenica TaxID=1088818 RepID=A0A2H9ZWN5_9ASPA|nr:RING-H2 finger protein ATL29 [Apostasia shenzhenica]